MNNNSEKDKTKMIKFGVNGFQNRNNTCFINSAIQCIIRIQPLKTYFDNKIYLNDLNPECDEMEKMFL